MNDLYWINTLGNLNVVMTIICIVSIIGTAISLAWFMDTNYFEEDDSSDSEQKNSKAVFRVFAISLIISSLFSIFIPAKEDLYVIYGVGTTIDYLKGSKEAKKLPDKAIKALNVFLDNKTKEDSISHK